MYKPPTSEATTLKSHPYPPLPSLSLPPPPSSLYKLLLTNFPYNPYPNQLSLMSSILTSLLSSSTDVTFLESPTGSGKSLSLLVSVMTWLEWKDKVDEYDVVKEEEEAVEDRGKDGGKDGGKDEDEDGLDWLTGGIKDDGLDWLSAPNTTTSTTTDASPSILSGTRTSNNSNNNNNAVAVSKLKNLSLATHSRLRTKLLAIANEIKRKYIDRHALLNVGAEGYGGVNVSEIRRIASGDVLNSSVIHIKAREGRNGRRNSQHGDCDGGNKRSKNKSKSKRSDSDDNDFCVEEGYKSNDDVLSSSSDDDDDGDDGDDGDNEDNEDNDAFNNSLKKYGLKAPGSNRDRKEKVSDYDLLNPYNLSGVKQPKNTYNAAGGSCDEKPIYPNDIGRKTGLRKVFYAARTHSQLSQFISEVNKTKWNKFTYVAGNVSSKNSGKSVLDGSINNNDDDLILSIVHAAGRKSQCCNTTVNDGKRSEDRVTEMCLDMLKSTASNTSASTTNTTDTTNGDVVGGKRKDPTTKKTAKCPFLESNAAQHQTSLHILSETHDVEDLASLSKTSNTCTYYASRSAIPGSRLVCLPYQILFSKQARESLGIDLKGSVVIVDEAHNIPESIRSMASQKIDLVCIERCERAIGAYVRKYEGRLGGKNLEYCLGIKRVVEGLGSYLRGDDTTSTGTTASTGTTDNEETKKEQPESTLLGLTEFMFLIKCDNINLCKLDRYITRSELNKKLLGFITAAAGGKSNRGDVTDENSDYVSKHISPLAGIHQFIQRLSGSSADGKVVVSRPKYSAVNPVHPSVRYFMLNPSTPFSEVVEEASTVILAGGTLRPFAHIASELMPMKTDLAAAALADSRDYDTPVTEGSGMTFFSCDHVVPRENVHCLSLSHGPDGNLLEFSFANRKLPSTLDSLGRTITNLCNVVPAGVVVFLPSYSYEAEVVRRWKETGAWETIKSKKRVFREPKDARDLDATLSNYARAVAKDNGAVLFSVVGGKMSEGINFADDMARCVVVVGLPFPDNRDPELKEKMAHLDREFKAAGGKGISGSSYYFNLCIRAVNQSIGRAIRHKGDYASIVLCDRRYISDPNVWKSLPGWITKAGGEGGGHGRLTAPPGGSNTFGKVLLGLRGFFNSMRPKSAKPTGK
jgi:chromosome transmission fidelity protein 1